MTPVVFAGPSLFGITQDRLSGLVVMPPAACGDLARAARSGAEAIGLIDGRFETAPSVWHKEILWALSQGVPVLGASSLGALRAAEMWPFGMRGVGTVYRLFRSGALTDDDEVAILHGPSEVGARPMTEAMVNMRATLRAARRQGVVSAAAETAIARIAKALFYKERTWERVFDLCEAQTGPRVETRALRERLGGLRRDVKQEDATLLLSRLRDVEALPVAESAFGFPATTFWSAFEKVHLRNNRPP